MKKLGLSLAVLAMSAASTAFAAPVGTITFTGELVTGTCDPTVGGAASGSVTLPSVNGKALAAPGDTAGDSAFKITLTGPGCDAGGKIANPYFEPETAKVNPAGRLINTETDTDMVDIQLLTDAGTVIDINKPFGTQEASAPVAAGPDTNDFNYKARYYAAADASAAAGAVAASVSYNILYK